MLRYVFCIIVALAFVRVEMYCQDGVLSTDAGTGVIGDEGDGSSADVATFALVVAVKPLPDGSYLVADNGANRIRKVRSDNVISAFAGTGVPGYSGDEGDALFAQFNNISDIEVDSQGNIYVADGGNSVIRKIDINNIVSTLFLTEGVNINYPRGLAIDASDNLYIASYLSGQIAKYDASGFSQIVAGAIEHKGTDIGDGGPAISAGLNGPGDVAVDSDGTFYILEMETSRIRKVDTSGNISIYAGTGAQGYFGDGADASSAQFYFDAEQSSKLEIDPSGNVIVADSGNHVIRKIDYLSHVVDTISGNGIATYAGDNGWSFEGSHHYPYAAACLANGDIIVADTENFRIRKISSNFSTSAGLNSQITIGEEVTMTFDQVTTSGEITVDVTDTVDAPIPGQLEINGKYYDINFSDGIFVGTVTVAVKYDPMGLSLGQQRKLKMLHYANGTWTDVTVEVRTNTSEIVGRVTSLSPFAVGLPEETITLVDFRRGDVNSDLEIDISDPVSILLSLFASMTPSLCVDASDADDNGEINITDAIYLLNSLFLNGPYIPPPGMSGPGFDLSEDSLTCESYPSS